MDTSQASLMKINKNLEAMVAQAAKEEAEAVPLEVRIRTVALVAAALQPNPGGTPLYERAEEHAKYIREGVLGENES